MSLPYQQSFEEEVLQQLVLVLELTVYSSFPNTQKVYPPPRHLPQFKLASQVMLYCWSSLAAPLWAGVVSRNLSLAKATVVPITARTVRDSVLFIVKNKVY